MEHSLYVTYTLDDDGIHLMCPECGTDESLGSCPDVEEIATAALKHRAIVTKSRLLKDGINPYEEELKEQQTRLTELAWRAHREKVTTVAVFEGWDAAGKGSAIRRMTAAIDPRLFRIVSIAAPTDEERAHHYFWRFWRQLPRAGRVFGRGRVDQGDGCSS